MPAFVQTVRRQWWRVLLLVALPVVGFWPARHGEFVLDDNLLLANCDIMKLPDGLYRIWFTTEPVDYYPVTNSSFWLEWRLWGLNPTGYHATNLILFIISCFLLWAVLEQLKIPGAYFAAVLFAVHPVNVESVAWIAQRKNLLALVFGLLSAWWYLKSDQPPSDADLASRRRNSAPAANRNAAWYWLSVVAFLLAMLSKGSVAVLPLLLLWITWYRRRLTKADFWRTAPLLVIAIVLTAVNIWSQSRLPDVTRTASFAERLLGAGAIVWFYLSKALWPVHLSFIYPQWNIRADSVLWWLPLASCVAFTAFLWRWRHINSVRATLLAWGFFCIALLPVMGFTDVGYMKYSLVADHYQQLALTAVVGWVAAAAVALRQTLEHSARSGIAKSIVAISVALVALLLGLMWKQSSLYARATTLYENVLEQNPDSWLAHASLSVADYDAGLLDESIRHAERAITLDPNAPEAYDALGDAWLHQGKIDQAAQQFEKSLSINDNMPVTHNNLGTTYASLGRWDDAIDQYQKALAARPYFPAAHNNLGLALVKLGKYPEAVRQHQDALLLTPDDPELYDNLGQALVAAGRYPEAIASFQQSLNRQPATAKLHYNLGIALSKLGDAAAAIQQFTAALQLNPDYAQAHVNLGIALTNSHRPQDALKHFQRALQIDPELIQAQFNLALTYAQLHQPDEAVAAGRQALQMARSQQRSDLVNQIEAWLKNLSAPPVKP